jgi:molecular chaperone DnaK (HSP70)
LETGDEALVLGAVAPTRLEEAPRRWLANGSTVVIAGEVLPLAEVLGAVLGRVVDETSRAAGRPPAGLAIGHPAGWPSTRTAVLADAARRVGFADALLVPEAVAAVVGCAPAVPAASTWAVFDLGAGSLATAVVGWDAGGWRVVGRPGGHERMGGDIFDDRLATLVGQQVSMADAATWHWLQADDDVRWQRARVGLRRAVRAGREELSVATITNVQIPALGRTITVAGEQLAHVVSREVAQCVAALDATIAEAGLPASWSGPVAVVGGATRTPQIRQALARRFGDRLVLPADPVGVVAIGIAGVMAGDPAAAVPSWRPAPVPAPVPSVAPVGRRAVPMQVALPVDGRRSSMGGAVWAVAAAVVLLAVAIGALAARW